MHLVSKCILKVLQTYKSSISLKQTISPSPRHDIVFMHGYVTHYWSLFSCQINSVLTFCVSFLRASEAQMISKIVKDVSNELPSTDFDRLVGVEAHVAKLK